MELIKRKLINDFFKADAIDTAIITHEMPLTTGVKILISLIKKVQTDIRLLDVEKYNELMEKVKSFNAKCKAKKKILQKEFDEKSDVDPYEQERHVINLKNEEHETLQEILSTIQDIAYGKGWFD